MTTSASSSLSRKCPPEALAVGCACCWAAGYCAAYAPASVPQPPPNCPLLVQPPLGPPRKRRR